VGRTTVAPSTREKEEAGFLPCRAETPKPFSRRLQQKEGQGRRLDGQLRLLPQSEKKQEKKSPVVVADVKWFHVSSDDEYEVHSSRSAAARATSTTRHHPELRPNRHADAIGPPPPISRGEGRAARLRPAEKKRLRSLDRPAPGPGAPPVSRAGGGPSHQPEPRPSANPRGSVQPCPLRSTRSQPPLRREEAHPFPFCAATSHTKDPPGSHRRTPGCSSGADLLSLVR